MIGWIYKNILGNPHPPQELSLKKNSFLYVLAVMQLHEIYFTVGLGLF